MHAIVCRGPGLYCTLHIPNTVEVHVRNIYSSHSVLPTYYSTVGILLSALLPTLLYSTLLCSALLYSSEGKLHIYSIYSSYHVVVGLHTQCCFGHWYSTVCTVLVLYTQQNRDVAQELVW